MTAKTMQDIVAQIEALPRLRDTALRLINVVNDPTSTLDDIVGTIRYDQMVTTQVLRLCNSAYFGLARMISSVDDAIRYLGTTKVLQLVMAAHTQGLLSRSQAGYGLPPGALWMHGVGVALTAQNLARRIDPAPAGVVFTTGLLHDVGKVVLNEYVANEFSEIVTLVDQGAFSFLEAERHVLGFTHPEIGGLVAETWNLPQQIALAIRYHHEPEALADPDPLVDTIHLADSICQLVGVGTGVDALLYRGAPAVMERHGLTAADLEVVGAETVAELKSVQKLFAGSE